MESKKMWITRRLDAHSVFIASPKEITDPLLIPAEMDGKKVLGIGPGACSPRKNLSLSQVKRRALNQVREIVVPDGVEAIAEAAFAYCERLERVELPDSVAELGQSVFEGCLNLKEVRLPAGLTEIPFETFCYCDRLERMEIPDTVTKIGKWAFALCDALQEIVISDEVVKKIGYQAMEDSGLLQCFLNQIRKGNIDFSPEIYRHLARYIPKKNEREKALICSGNDAAIRQVLSLQTKLTLQRMDEYLALAEKAAKVAK